MATPMTDREVEAVVSELSRTDAARAAVPPIFCQNWATARALLKLIGASSSSWVKLAVSVVLQIGDALYKKCPSG